MSNTALSLLNNTINKLVVKNNQWADFVVATNTRMSELAHRIVEDYAEYGQTLHKLFRCFGGPAQNAARCMKGYHQIVYRNALGSLTFGYMIDSDYIPYVDITVNNSTFRVMRGTQTFSTSTNPSYVKAIRKFIDAVDMDGFDTAASETLAEVAQKYA